MFKKPKFTKNFSEGKILTRLLRRCSYALPQISNFRRLFISYQQRLDQFWTQVRRSVKSLGRKWPQRSVAYFSTISRICLSINSTIPKSIWIQHKLPRTGSKISPPTLFKYGALIVSTPKNDRILSKFFLTASHSRNLWKSNCL